MCYIPLLKALTYILKITLEVRHITRVVVVVVVVVNVSSHKSSWQILDSLELL